MDNTENGHFTVQFIHNLTSIPIGVATSGGDLHGIYARCPSYLDPAIVSPGCLRSELYIASQKMEIWCADRDSNAIPSRGLRDGGHLNLRLQPTDYDAVRCRPVNALGPIRYHAARVWIVISTVNQTKQRQNRLHPRVIYVAGVHSGYTFSIVSTLIHIQSRQYRPALGNVHSR